MDLETKPCIRILGKSREKHGKIDRISDIPQIVHHSVPNSPEGSPSKALEELPQPSATSEGWGEIDGRVSIPLDLLPPSSAPSPPKQASAVSQPNGSSTPRAVSWDRIREAMRTECPSPEDAGETVDPDPDRDERVVGNALNFEESDDDVEDEKQDPATTLFFGSDGDDSPAYDGVDERSFQEDTWLKKQGNFRAERKDDDQSSEDEFSASEPMFDPAQRTEVFLLPTTEHVEERGSLPRRLFSGESSRSTNMSSPKLPRTASSFPKMTPVGTQNPGTPKRETDLSEVKELKATLVASLYRRTDREACEVPISELTENKQSFPVESESNFLQDIDVKVEQKTESAVTLKFETEEASDGFSYGPLQFTEIERQDMRGDASQWEADLRREESLAHPEDQTANDADVKEVFGGSILSLSEPRQTCFEKPRPLAVRDSNPKVREEKKTERRTAPLMAPPADSPKPLKIPEDANEDVLSSFFISGVEGELEAKKDANRKQATEAFANRLSAFQESQSNVVVGNWKAERPAMKKRLTPLLPPTKD